MIADVTIQSTRIPRSKVSAFELTGSTKPTEEPWISMDSPWRGAKNGGSRMCGKLGILLLFPWPSTIIVVFFFLFSLSYYWSENVYRFQEEVCDHQGAAKWEIWPAEEEFKPVNFTSNCHCITRLTTAGPSPWFRSHKICKQIRGIKE